MFTMHQSQTRVCVSVQEIRKPVAVFPFLLDVEFHLLNSSGSPFQSVPNVFNKRQVWTTTRPEKIQVGHVLLQSRAKCGQVLK